jgi:benzodiazapine receptor
MSILYRIKRRRRLLLGRMRSELCRINLKCIIIGAIISLICGFVSWLAGAPLDSDTILECPRGSLPIILIPFFWMIMYAIIGGAAGAVVCARERALEADKYKGMLFFVIMMVFSFVWPPLFFGAQAYFAAFMAILMTMILNFFTIIFFLRIYIITGISMIFYMAWLFYMAYFNLAIIILN